MNGNQTKLKQSKTKDHTLGSSSNSSIATLRPHRNSTDDLLIELVDVLEKIDTTKPLAKLNETTISDNNGGRIEL